MEWLLSIEMGEVQGSGLARWTGRPLITDERGGGFYGFYGFSGVGAAHHHMETPRSFKIYVIRKRCETCEPFEPSEPA